MSAHRPIYTNYTAKSWTSPSTPDKSLIQAYHSRLPNFTKTPLVPLSDLAAELGLSKVYVKDESSRAGLPAYKILGASWATFRAICSRCDLSLTTSLVEVSKTAQQRGYSLFTATDGNHGRAVARMASYLGVPAEIFVPRFSDAATRGRIASEGANVKVVDGDYDAAVAAAHAACQTQPETGLFIQDMTFPGNEDVPLWCAEGYSTLFTEIEDALTSAGTRPSLIVTPVGAGCLAHAVVNFCKAPSSGKIPPISILAIEPITSACLNASLFAGEMTTIPTGTTIMDGMNCGTVSGVSWPTLQKGVDVSLTITDLEAHWAVEYLQEHGVDAGPCGAGALAGLRKLMSEPAVARGIGVGEDSVVVLLCTEGKREYVVPGEEV